MLKLIRKKPDIEAILFMYILKLKEETNKQFSTTKVDHNIVYVFNNFIEYKQYFIDNGFQDIDEEMLKICKMKITKKGSVLALKGLCDYAITCYKYGTNTALDNNKLSKKKTLN